MPATLPRSTPSGHSSRYSCHDPVGENGHPEKTLTVQPTNQAGSPLNTVLTAPRVYMVDSYVEVPSEPGLGVTLDWTVVERYRVR